MSVATGGAEGNDAQLGGSISADGRFVAFQSFATNLVAGDTNGFLDIFVRDRLIGTTERVSVSTLGAEADDRQLHTVDFGGRSLRRVREQCNEPGRGRHERRHRHLRARPRLGDDRAREVVDWRRRGQRQLADARALRRRPLRRLLELRVESRAGRHERHARRLRPRPRDGPDGAGERHQRRRRSSIPRASPSVVSISPDGRYVVVRDSGANLVPRDTNGGVDIFVHDRLTGTTERVSVATDGTQATDHSDTSASISTAGRAVAFQSVATNLVDRRHERHQRHLRARPRPRRSPRGRHEPLRRRRARRRRAAGLRHQTRARSRRSARPAPCRWRAAWRPSSAPSRRAARPTARPDP